LGRRGAGCLRVGGAERRQGAVPAVRQPPCEATLQLTRQIGERGAVGVPAPFPVGVEPGTALLRAAPARQRLLRHVKRLERWPAERLLRELHFVDAEWGPVRLGAILLVGTAEGDMGADDNQ